jgi:hypothetical protein
MTPEPADVLHLISTACAAIFLLILPVRLWKLRSSGIRNVPSWKGRFKAVSILVSPITGTRSFSLGLIMSLGTRAITCHYIVRVLDKGFKLRCSA